METEIVREVLTEVLEELKEVNVMVQNQNKAVGELGEKLAFLEDKLARQQIIVPPQDLKPVLNLLSSGIKELKQTVAAQPKNVIHEKRFLLFPESDKGDKVNYRKLFYLITVLLLFLILLFEVYRF